LVLPPQADNSFAPENASGDSIRLRVKIRVPFRGSVLDSLTKNIKDLRVQLPCSSRPYPIARAGSQLLWRVRRDESESLWCQVSIRALIESPKYDATGNQEKPSKMSLKVFICLNTNLLPSID